LCGVVVVAAVAGQAAAAAEVVEHLAAVAMIRMQLTSLVENTVEAFVVVIAG
jgi:ribulose-5-phosphate 4-epimerase/fuculose-1-phosphate aldolase